MAIYSSIGIIGSVGRRGQNQPPDVAAVQTRLNDLMRAPRIRLEPDGLSGRKTRGMIRDFQRSVLEFKWPDGRVDPAGKTFVALNDPDSEGIWARMSIPPEESGGGGGATPKPGSKSITKDDAIDQAIDDIKSAHVLSVSEEEVIRKLLEDIWKSGEGGFNVVGPGGMTEEDLDKWTGYAMDTFKVSKAAFSMAAANTIFWSAAQVMGFLGPFLMFAGFVRQLSFAMSSGARIYGGISVAYYTTYWAHGGMKPIACKTFMDSQASAPEEWRTDPDKLENYWRKGQSDALAGLDQYCHQTALKAGTSVEDTRKAIKAVLRTIDKKVLAQGILKHLSEQFRGKSDINVADALARHSRDLAYPN